MRSRTIVVVIVYLFCFTLTSCSTGSTPDGYLSVNTDSAYFIQFTEQSHQLNGHLQGITETNDTPPQTKSSSTAFTGAHNGSSITIAISVFGFSSSLVGTLSGNTLILEVPQTDGHLQSETFTGASLQEYNQAVDEMQKKVGDIDKQYYNDQATVTTQNANDQETATAARSTQTAIGQEQQAVENANAATSNALSTLKSDSATLAAFSNTSTITGYANDWQTMQNDYATEQKDARVGCGDNNSNYSQVSADNNQVRADLNQISADDNQLLADKNQYNADLSPVQNDRQAVKDAWMQLQQVVANNATNTPASAYTTGNINTALQDAQNAEATASGTWQSAQADATKYDQEANALQKQADTLTASMHCG